MRRFFLLFLLAVSGSVVFSQQLIEQGTEWKYFDNGSGLSSDWVKPDFDDSKWKQGKAQFGFGDGDESTVINKGEITYYFRHKFEVANPQLQKGLNIELLRDAGAVVYLNGKEVLRTNMPLGKLTDSTFASRNVWGESRNTFFEFNVPSTFLKKGENLIAVELHQKRKNNKEAGFDLKMEFSDYTYGFRKKPYLLYTGKNTEMLILWQLEKTEECTVRWGEDKNYSSGKAIVKEYGDDHQFKLLLSGLMPEKKYYYKVENEEDSFESSFVTGASSTTTSFSFYAYGDTRTQPYKHNVLAKQVLAEIEKDPLSQTFIVNSGDLVTHGNKEADWDNQFFSPKYTYLNKMMSELPYLTAVGNHEGNGILFKKYFPYPEFSSDSAVYFSFDYGNVHFIVIDQFADYSKGSEQYKWIVNDLKTSDKPWKIALFHMPGWSAGGHENAKRVQDLLQPLFVEYNVPLAINGHNHYYSHALVNGVHHITTGGGGAPLYKPDNKQPNLLKTDKSHHFLKISVLDNNRLKVSVIRSDGSIIEDFEIKE